MPTGSSDVDSFLRSRECARAAPVPQGSAASLALYWSTSNSIPARFAAVTAGVMSLSPSPRDVHVVSLPAARSARPPVCMGARGPSLREAVVWGHFPEILLFANQVAAAPREIRGLARLRAR